MRHPSKYGLGESFQEMWCQHCALRRDAAGDHCRILVSALNLGFLDPDYPVELRLTRDDLGRPSPICTAFEDLSKPRLAPRCPDTLDLFGDAA